MSDDEWQSWIDTETIPNEGGRWLPWFLGIGFLLIIGLTVLGVALGFAER